MDPNNFPDLSTPPHPDFRSGMIALVGAANAGKSSLINFILDEKVSIVSSVAQTTRNLVRGIYTDDDAQLVFLDTPGVHRAQASLGKQMNKMARTSIAGVDAVVLVIDRSSKPALEVDGWMRKLAVEEGEDGEPIPIVFALNKCDRERTFEEEIKTLWEEIREETACTRSPEWFKISAQTGDGVEALKKALTQLLPKGPMLFPEQMLTDFPKKLNMGDVIREKYFLRLKQELPHSLAVWVDSIDERETEWRIDAVVYVQRSSQKGIVIGNKGRMLKAVKSESEKELHEMYGVRIRLNLIVKIEKHWDENFWILRKLGYA